MKGINMVTKIYDTPSIWQIHVELPQNPLRALNSYVICTPEANLVIDTGFNCTECSRDLWAGINELKLDMSKTALFITHLHSDHIGLVQDFVNHGCKIYMGEIDYNYLKESFEGNYWRYMEDLFHREGMPPEVVNKQATENQARKLAPEQMFPAELVNDQTVIRLGRSELICLHTPGHTPGHIVLYMPEEKILFSGDHILFDITPNISIWKDIPSSLADYLSSLERIRELPVRLTLPGHRAYRNNIYERIDELIAHHHERLEEILQVVAKEPGLNADQIASKISWSARGKSWAEFPPHQKWFAMGETLAHLYYLQQIGKVERQEDEDKLICYHPEGNDL